MEILATIFFTSLIYMYKINKKLFFIPTIITFVILFSLLVQHKINFSELIGHYFIYYLFPLFLICSFLSIFDGIVRKFKFLNFFNE